MDSSKRKISIALEPEPAKKIRNGQSCQNCNKVNSTFHFANAKYLTTYKFQTKSSLYCHGVGYCFVS